MPPSDTAVRKFVALAIDAVEGASTRLMFSSPFEESSIARVEQNDIAAAGITDNDVTSMFTVRQMLDTYSRSATAHIRAAAVLMGSDGSPTPVLSIAALSRISCEASGTAFWLSDPELPWDERLKRCNQLQFKMIEDALRWSEKFAVEYSTSWIESTLAEYRDEMIDLIDFARQRDWNHQDKAPSRSNWSKGIPTFTQLMRDLMTSIGEPAAVGQMLYSLGSGAVHSNPILVHLAFDQITPAAGQYAAAFRIKTALRCHQLLMDRISQWTAQETDKNWFDELEQTCQALQIRYLYELQSSSDPTGELQEYLQHLSEVLGSMRDRDNEETS